ncbi:hypothetical protein GCM10022222_22880 [Amycolatopsis ultiminotia]|uniref:Uncharacterized protein n=1 Tax=Amycolatopsis ultiminotia TaxID=543629 RepID=A0ABP6VRQ4_9PSEU
MHWFKDPNGLLELGDALLDAVAFGSGAGAPLTELLHPATAAAASMIPGNAVVNFNFVTGCPAFCSVR